MDPLARESSCLCLPSAHTICTQSSMVVDMGTGYTNLGPQACLAKYFNQPAERILLKGLINVFSSNRDHFHYKINLIIPSLCPYKRFINVWTKKGTYVS